MKKVTLEIELPDETYEYIMEEYVGGTYKDVESFLEELIDIGIQGIW